jgi:hypothetical protein
VVYLKLIDSGVIVEADLRIGDKDGMRAMENGHRAQDDLSLEWLRKIGKRDSEFDVERPGHLAGFSHCICE